jgi:hypothetical protein
MAETEKGKKIVYVHPYQRDDGSRVPAHERSTPSTSRGAERPSRSQPRQTKRRTSR